jgi:tetratricopeptide (TPR) repeat protein
MKRIIPYHISLLVTALLTSLFSYSAYSQSWRKELRAGNEYYNRNNFKEAENKYKESSKKNPDSFDAQFNQGDALYKQKKYDEAIQKFGLLKDKTKDEDKLSKLYHNLGNSYLQAKKYEESIDAFKKSLKLLPKDNDTKYNLAYANAMLQKKKEEQQKKKNQKNKGGEKNKKDQNSTSGDNKNKDKKPEKKEGDNNPQNPNQMSKEQAEQLLKAMEGKEKDVQQKVNAQRVKGARIKIEKDW